MTKFLTYIYYLFISYLFLKPTGNIRAPFWGFDKLVHITFFAILTILLKLSFKQNFKNQEKLWIIFLFIYATTIEILQYLMQLGRTFSVFDIMADLVGVYIAIRLTNLSKHY